VLTLLPAVVLVTLTETVQVEPGVAIEPPERLRVLLPEAPPEIVPPQVLLRFGVEATVMPVGNVSVTAIPLMAPALVAGFVMV
jgi:hypothetical protein